MIFKVITLGISGFQANKGSLDFKLKRECKTQPSPLEFEKGSGSENPMKTTTTMVSSSQLLNLFDVNYLSSCTFRLYLKQITLPEAISVINLLPT